MMKVLFLDQSAQLGGAELSLKDVAAYLQEDALVGLFEDGPYRQVLEAQQTDVTILSHRPLRVNRHSSGLAGLRYGPQIMHLAIKVARLSRGFDMIYANTQKAMIVGALASAISHRPLVYHLRDILSTDHFSRFNCRLAAALASRFARVVIANSEATRDAFIQAGGQADRVQVIYNGFDLARFEQVRSALAQSELTLANLARDQRRRSELNDAELNDAELNDAELNDADSDGLMLSHPTPLGTRLDDFTIKPFARDPGMFQNTHSMGHQLDWAGKFVVGHFSRFAPWKGQHVLLEALAQCPDNVVALLVGSPLFGESDYENQLRQMVVDLGLADRVRFLGFCHDVPELMQNCDLVAHTSIAPEPFGRVIVEAMLGGTPVVVAQAGGAAELVEAEVTGWLVPPGDALALATTIMQCHDRVEQRRAIARRARSYARTTFDLRHTNGQIFRLLEQVLAQPSGWRANAPIEKPSGQLLSRRLR
jgi:glycosyltransferase involved in cell wall biosynthesis